MGFFDKLFGKKEKESLDEGLQKTKDNFFAKVSKAIAGKSTVDEEVLDNLEEALVSADVGIVLKDRVQIQSQLGGYNLAVNPMWSAPATGAPSSVASAR